MSCLCHLFPIEKVVRHSTAGKHRHIPTAGKGNRGKNEGGVYEYNHSSYMREY